MISSCPICNVQLLTVELEWHANSHFEDGELETDTDLAHQVALAESCKDIMGDDQLETDMDFAHQVAVAESCTDIMDDDQLDTDMDLAHQVALAESCKDIMSGPECYVGGSFASDSNAELSKKSDSNAQGASSSHSGDSSHYGEGLLGEQISCLVEAQSRSRVREIQGGIMSLLRTCLESEGGSSTSIIISGHIDHHQSLPSEDEGWGCGWRNIQMLSSHLLKQRPEARQVLFGGAGFVPDIPSLQRWLEIAWDKKFDALGSSHFHNKVYGAQEWIGTTECATLFRSFGLRARIVDFDSTESSAGLRSKNGKRAVRGPMDKFVVKNNPAKSSSELSQEDLLSMRGPQVIFHWVWNYFASGHSDKSDTQRVAVSDKTPLYFQHEGHSRTIVGIQKKKDQYNLLILDPGHRTADLEKYLRRKRGWQGLVKRGVHTLKKPQYQLCYVDPGIANSEEMEQLKTIDSVLIQF